MAKRFTLPKEHLAEPEEGAQFIDGEDVEGHGLPTTAPPSLGSRGAGHGGENVPTPIDDEDDLEGHRL